MTLEMTEIANFNDRLLKLEEGLRNLEENNSKIDTNHKISKV